MPETCEHVLKAVSLILLKMKAELVLLSRQVRLVMPWRGIAVSLGVRDCCTAGPLRGSTVGRESWAAPRRKACNWEAISFCMRSWNPIQTSTPFIRKDTTAESNPWIPVAPPTAVPYEIPNWYMAGAHCKRQPLESPQCSKNHPRLDGSQDETYSALLS